MILKLNSNLIITTSRKPSQNTRRFAQFLKHYFNCPYLNRGKQSFNKMINLSKEYNDSLLLVITETKGNPSNIDVYDTDKDSENPLYKLYINVSLPKENKRINVNNEEILFINKTNQLKSLNELFTEIKVNERIKNNCIVILDDDKNDNLAKIVFMDKNGENTNYSIYLKGLKDNS